MIRFLLLLLCVGGLILPSPKNAAFAQSTTEQLSSVLSLQIKNTPYPTQSSFWNLLPTKIFPSTTPTPTPTPPQKDTEYCLDVPILFYHHIQPLPIAATLGHAQLTVDNMHFDSQMAYLAANKYHAISADELVDALRYHHGLPPKSILITIDDGYDDNYTYAFPILKKYNITGNFMISSGLIGNTGYMTWKQLQEMRRNSLMHFYNHTWSHADLTGASKEKIQKEINLANKQLSENLGSSISIFTYPYGSFNPLVINILKEQGFIGAFSTIDGRIQCNSYIFALRRLRIGNAPLSSYGL